MGKRNYDNNIKQMIKTGKVLKTYSNIIGFDDGKNGNMVRVVNPSLTIDVTEKSFLRFSEDSKKQVKLKVNSISGFSLDRFSFEIVFDISRPENIVFLMRKFVRFIKIKEKLKNRFFTDCNDYFKRNNIPYKRKDFEVYVENCEDGSYNGLVFISPKWRIIASMSDCDNEFKYKQLVSAVFSDILEKAAPENVSSLKDLTNYTYFNYSISNLPAMYSDDAPARFYRNRTIMYIDRK